jgi:hypothetical protein
MAAASTEAQKVVDVGSYRTRGDCWEGVNSYGKATGADSVSCIREHPGSSTPWEGYVVYSL